LTRISFYLSSPRLWLLPKRHRVPLFPRGPRLLLIVSRDSSRRFFSHTHKVSSSLVSFLASLNVFLRFRRLPNILLRGPDIPTFFPSRFGHGEWIRNCSLNQQGSALISHFFSKPSCTSYVPAGPPLQQSPTRKVWFILNHPLAAYVFPDFALMRRLRSPRWPLG